MAKYLKIREQVTELVTFKTLKPRDRIVQAFIWLYKKSSVYTSKMEDIRRKKDKALSDKTQDLVESIILTCYEPLYVQGKESHSVYINPNYDDVLLAALKSPDLADYKIDIHTFGSASVKYFFEDLPFLLHVKIR